MERPVYLIIGASGGIGSATARRLADRGRLVLAARGEAALKEVAAPLGARVTTVDATVYEDVERCIKDVAQTEGRLDGIALCVGSILLKPAHLTSVEEFEAVQRVNLFAAFYVVKAGTRAMMAAGGAIVLCSSAVARVGLVNHEAIAAAKAGVQGLTASAAATYAHRNIRVNCVAPGLVETGMSAPILRTDQGRAQSEGMHPLGRIGQPDDVAEAVAWLLDGERSGWVTGQVIGVDGGLGTVRPR